MASPQLEHGYIRIAHELVLALMRARLTATQLAIALCVLERTYGAKGSPIWARISGLMLAHDTGIAPREARRILDTLAKKRVVNVEKTGQGRAPMVCIQKDWELWKCPLRPVDKWNTNRLSTRGPSPPASKTRGVSQPPTSPTRGSQPPPTRGVTAPHIQDQDVSQNRFTALPTSESPREGPTRVDVAAGIKALPPNLRRAFDAAAERRKAEKAEGGKEMPKAADEESGE